MAKVQRSESQRGNGLFFSFVFVWEEEIVFDDVFFVFPMSVAPIDKGGHQNERKV